MASFSRPIGTIKQLSHVTGIPERTLQGWATNNRIKRVGKDWPPLYDLDAVMQMPRRRRRVRPELT